MLTSNAERQAWYRNTLAPSDWLVPLPAAAVAECEEVVRELRREPLPTLLLSAEQFGLSHCREVMARVGRQLREGIGLAVIDKLPVERFSLEENQALGWLLGSLLGRLVAQKWDGTMVYDVRDTGKALEYGVRPSVKNLDLQFPTDAPWVALPPRVDDEVREALQAMRGITDSPELCVEFRIEKGQIQYLNNRLFAHSRTPFRDSDVPGQQRHLIRLWNRDEGRQNFHG